MTAGEALKEIRAKLGITQEELAHSIHVTFNSVNRWENNKSNPNKMARALLTGFCEKNGIDKELIEVFSVRHKSINSNEK